MQIYLIRPRVPRARDRLIKTIPFTRGVIVGGPLVRAKQTESFILFGVFLSGSIAGLTWAFTQGVGWVAWAEFALMYALTTVGIGLTVHRYLVHRSFKAGPVVKFFLCAIGQMACQGSLLKWVGNHRRHHLYTDEVGDPHSPYLDGKGNPFTSKLKSWAYSNNGWLFDDTMTDNTIYAKDMLADPMVMFSPGRAGSGISFRWSAYPPSGAIASAACTRCGERFYSPASSAPISL